MRLLLVLFVQNFLSSFFLISFSNSNILPKIKLELFYDGNVSDTKCYDFRPTQAMLYELNKVNAAAFVGFSCYCLTVAKVLSALNLPIISHVSVILFSFIFDFPDMVSSVGKQKAIQNCS